MTSVKECREEGNFVDKHMLLVIFGIIMVLTIGISLLFGPEIPSNDPDVNKNIKQYSCNQLWDMSIHLSNRGWSPDPNTQDIFNHPYSPTLQLELNQLKEKGC